MPPPSPGPPCPTKGRAGVGHGPNVSPGGWQVPGQRPEFEATTLALRGRVQVEHERGVPQVAAGPAVVTAAGEWVRYGTPDPDGQST